MKLKVSYLFQAVNSPQYVGDHFQHYLDRSDFNAASGK